MEIIYALFTLCGLQKKGTKQHFVERYHNDPAKLNFINSCAHTKLLPSTDGDIRIRLRMSSEAVNACDNKQDFFGGGQSIAKPLPLQQKITWTGIL
jgi:hypothetical protein